MAEDEELEFGVWLPMDKFMEVLNLMMEVCTILHNALGDVTDDLPDHPILTLVKKVDPEKSH